MKKVSLLALLLPLLAHADGNVSGYVQEHLAFRTGSKSACAGVEGCSVMVNEQRVQLLGEWQPVQGLASTLRVDALHDGAAGGSTVLVREAYVDGAIAKQVEIRAGRQVITWGVADYLFVNDIFPKNYDAFFTGKPFDHMKEAVDAVKLNAVAGEMEIEVVAARPDQDGMPSQGRFISAALPPGMLAAPAGRHGTDFAARIAGRFGRWDTAAYAARYHSREPGLYMVPKAGLAWEMQPTRHFGVSATASAGNGVVLAEAAYIDTDLKSGNMNRYTFGRQVKALAGYSADFGDDLNASLQYHLERSLDYSAYVNSLAPQAAPTSRERQTLYARGSKKLLHQTLGLGMQAFVAFDGGRYLNPFASYSMADGWNWEVGANLFDGKATSRYGSMKRDSNLYTSLRYSF
jgi:hypothetical protein